MFIDLLIFYFYVNNKYFIIIQKYDICCHNIFISKWKYFYTNKKRATNSMIALDILFINHATNSEAVEAEVGIPVSIATAEEQAAGALPTTSVKRTRPIVTVTAYVFDTAIVTVASSREE